MKKYLKIKNSNEMEVEALTLLGASSKVGDSTKIGQFGSGNKYAIAYLLRNGYNLKIFSGLKEIAITTETENFRNNEFQTIHVNGIRTSITTSFGKDFRLWEAIRELYSNALDEDNGLIQVVEKIQPIEGETHFYIESNPEVNEIIQNFDRYFAFGSRSLSTNKNGKILEKRGEYVNLYRKGIRAYDEKVPSLFDYDFDNITITESRRITYYWEIYQNIWTMILNSDSTKVINEIFLNSLRGNLFEFSISASADIGGTISKEFEQILRTKPLVPIEYSGTIPMDEMPGCHFLPNKVVKHLTDFFGQEIMHRNFVVGRNAMVQKGTFSAMEQAMLNKAMSFFKECGFEIPYNIEKGIFERQTIWGQAVDQTIYLSNMVFIKGTSRVVNTIVEEYIHIKHGVDDCTRSFQEAAIDELIKYMESKNAILL